MANLWLLFSSLRSFINFSKINIYYMYNQKIFLKKRNFISQLTKVVYDSLGNADTVLYSSLLNGLPSLTRQN